MITNLLFRPAVVQSRGKTLRAIAVVAAFCALSGCGVASTAGSVVGGAVDLTVDAVDTTTDIVTAPF